MATFFNNSDEKRKFLVARNFKPLMKGTIEDNNVLIESSGAAHCNDSAVVYLLKEGNLIKDIKFTSVACVITTSSIDIILEKIINKDIDYALSFLENYLLFIEGKDCDKEILEELIVFEEIIKKGNRTKCLKFPYDIIYNVLNK